MKASEIKMLRLNLIKTSVWQCIPHIVFFWLRTISFAVIKISTYDLIPRIHLVRDSINDVLYLTQQNLFQLYIALDSLVHANAIKYRLSTVLLLHNAILCLFIAAFTFRPQLKYWILISILTTIFIGEALYTIYILYQKRYEFEFELFKKVGINQKINSAYTTRKFLESVYALGFFNNSAMLGRFIYNPLHIMSEISIAVLIYVIISTIQYLFVSVRLNEEIVQQRKLAILLSVSKVFVAMLLLVYHWWLHLGCTCKKMVVDVLLFTDTIILSILETYCVFIDWHKFGSGLKKRLAFNATRLNLVTQSACIKK